jgi:hypothetical protein
MKHLVYLPFLLVSSLCLAATSSEERAQLKYQATLQTGYDYKTSDTQLSLGMFLKPDQMMNFKAGVGKDGDDKQTTFALQYKYFTGNSFYLAPELYYLNYSESDKHKTLFDSVDENVTALGAGLRIGNQWQWQHFTLGCDWFGMGSNFAHWKRTEDSFSNPLTFTILNFYLGASF